MKILAISGSLRARSSNTNLLRAAARLAPEGMHIEPAMSVGELPHFNPDLDTEAAPARVKEFRAQLASADGFIISSPEYAHGVPGSLKNALDWTVSSGDFVNKPVLLITSSTGTGEYASAQLTETLAVTMAILVQPVQLLGPLVRKAVSESGEVSDAETERALRAGLERLSVAADAKRRSDAL